MAQSNGALWKKGSGDKTFLAGTAEMPFDGKKGEKIGVLVFKNKYKKESKHPDFVIFINPPENRGEKS